MSLLQPRYDRERKVWRIPTRTYHVFGSGTAWARLVVDGQRIVQADSTADNGFVGVDYAHVPTTEVLSWKNVQFESGAMPGSKRRFEGTGRKFVYWATADVRVEKDAHRRNTHTAAMQHLLWWPNGILHKVVAEYGDDLPAGASLHMAAAVICRLEEEGWRLTPTDIPVVREAAERALRIHRESVAAAKRRAATNVG